MPDSNDLASLQLLILNSRAQISTAVYFACRKYNHGSPPDEVEEFSEQIIALLLEDNCRRLQTFDSAKAKYITWLNKVVSHHIQHHYQRQPVFALLDELSSTQTGYTATQERDLLKKEQLKLIQAAINELNHHDQIIATAKLNEISNEEIAEELQIKAASVAREWRVIKTKLARRLTVEWQSKAKQSKAKQSKAKQSCNTI